MNSIRFNAYRIMWLIVFFDMPTETRRDRKAYVDFRNHLLGCGFTMFQYSVYTRHCMSKEHAEKFKRAVRAELPEKGHIVMAMLTDKQFGLMEIFHGIKQSAAPSGFTQLEFF